MDRGDDTRADQERTDQAEAEGEDGEQDGPAFEGVALLHHDRRVEEGGRYQPGHEGSVLHRIPEPPAAPAQRVVSPAAAEADSRREAEPGGERPGPDPA